MGEIRKFFAKMIEHKNFEAFILVAIIIDSIQLAYYYFMIPTEELTVVMVIDRFFFSLFSLEAAIKIMVHQRDYFRSSWNIFDFTILILTLSLLLSMMFSDIW